ncbi:mucin-2-like isoform X2 [Halichondria panicea]|uniref:mucin-2-like isoform X2 n=1 Tax=Halichondria panicea TaxID=6063 RepID=UPI00312B566B
MAYQPQRRNTVSKSSGPSHMNSYALRGIPIKYKPPLFVPDIQYLPATWKPPEMLSANIIGYDYSLETAILSQARQRAVSVAAEESLKRQQIDKLKKELQEREEAAAKAARELIPPQPLFSNDILTPTPVASNATKLSAANSVENSEDSDSPKSTSGIELTVEPPIKTLGQISIREFETNTHDDPFEIASLQAINDMEVLQSVLQPIPLPIISTPTSTSPPLIQTSQQNSTTQMPGLGTSPTRSHSSPIPTPRTSRTQLTANSSGLYPSTTPPTAVAPVSSQVPSYPNPFMANNSTNNVPVNPSEPGVGLLIDFGGDFTLQPPPTSVQSPPTLVQPAPTYVQPPPTLVQPPPTVTASATAVDQPQGSSHPVPKLRTHIPPPSIPPYPNGASSAPNQTSPIVPPKGIRPATKNHPPARPPKPKGHVGFTILSNSSPSSNRPGFGVPVLPPIPTSAAPPTTTAPQMNRPLNIPPPLYTSPILNKRILPPYSSPPKTYKLPDPMSSLTVSQKSEVKSLSGMGFPLPRVARAMLRYEGDNTKILDFLFLVGRLEEQKFSGDSAEVALIACKDDESKAVEYLNKVEGFKNIGFSEKKIHDAFEKSGKDWDKALDLLTEDR